MSRSDRRRKGRHRRLSRLLTELRPWNMGKLCGAKKLRMLSASAAAPAGTVPSPVKWWLAWISSGCGALAFSREVGATISMGCVSKKMAERSALAAARLGALVFMASRRLPARGFLAAGGRRSEVPPVRLLLAFLLLPVLLPGRGAPASLAAREMISIVGCGLCWVLLGAGVE